MKQPRSSDSGWSWAFEVAHLETDLAALEDQVKETRDLLEEARIMARLEESFGSARPEPMR